MNSPTEMDPAVFRDAAMGLRDRLIDLRIEDRLSYDPETNTVFMNYAGMRIRGQDDLDRIRTAVDTLLEPLNKRVHSVVNYDSFDASPEVMDAYLDLVRYVEERYYLDVSRYTTSGFMRLKLGKGLGERHASSHVFESRAEARERPKL
jgi:propionate CoA-transferase